jgi:hypothetical protein
MTEGDTYPCSWTRTPDGYRVWLIDDPSIAAEAADFEGADELLSDRICDATGDGESVHVYDPLEPNLPNAGASERRQLWKLGRPTKVYMVEPRRYFSDGLCAHCLMPRGTRTNVPLWVTQLRKSLNSAMVVIENVGVSPVLTIVSEPFLALLTAEERAGFEWRPIEHNLRQGTYYEVVHRQPPAPWISAKGRSTYYSRCEMCGFEWVIPNYVPGLPDYYVAERDLPTPRPTLVAIGPWAYADLAVTPERWRELVKQPGMRGTKGLPISIISEDAVERAPKQWLSRERTKRKDGALGPG